MHKWQDRTKLNPLPYLELLLVLGVLLALIFLYPPSQITEFGVWIGRMITQ